jgi:hypothetical protein
LFYAVHDLGFGFKGRKNPATVSGAGLKKTGFILFSFALLAGRPYQGGVQVLNNKSGDEAMRKNSNRGRTRGKRAGLFQHHSVAHEHARGTYIETKRCQTMATFSVASEHASGIIAKLKRALIKGRKARVKVALPGEAVASLTLKANRNQRDNSPEPKR